MTTLDVPADLGNCAEQDCMTPACTTRPMRQPWITPLGAVLEGDEWVCDKHALPVPGVDPYGLAGNA